MPTSRENAKASVLAARLEARRKKKDQKAVAKVEAMRRDAIDYHVEVNGRPFEVTDDLDVALKRVKELRETTDRAITLARLVHGRVDTGCWHGSKFVGWERPNGTRDSNHVPRKS